MWCVCGSLAYAHMQRPEEDILGPALLFHLVPSRQFFTEPRVRLTAYKPQKSFSSHNSAGVTGTNMHTHIFLTWVLEIQTWTLMLQQTLLTH